LAIVLKYPNYFKKISHYDKVLFEGDKMLNEATNETGKFIGSRENYDWSDGVMGKNTFLRSVRSSLVGHKEKIIFTHHSITPNLT